MYYTRYVFGSFAYGFVRGVYYTDRIKSRDGERMLIGTKLFGIMMSTFMAPVASPYYLFEDLNHVDETYVLKRKVKTTDVFPFPGYRL